MLGESECHCLAHVSADAADCCLCGSDHDASVGNESLEEAEATSPNRATATCLICQFFGSAQIDSAIDSVGLGLPWNGESVGFGELDVASLPLLSQLPRGPPVPCFLDLFGRSRARGWFEIFGAAWRSIFAIAAGGHELGILILGVGK